MAYTNTNSHLGFYRNIAHCLFPQKERDAQIWSCLSICRLVILEGQDYRSGGIRVLWTQLNIVLERSKVKKETLSSSVLAILLVQEDNFLQ